MRFLCALFVLTLFAPSLYSQTVVFLGSPKVRQHLNWDGAEKHVLTEAEGREYECRIVEKAGEYFWASRENTPMVKREFGVFIVFIAVNGSGYVKIQQRLDPAGILQRDYEYVEHLPTLLTSFNYWGKAVINKLPK